MNPNGSARPWEECRADIYHRLSGLEGWSRAQGDRCERLHSALDECLEQRADRTQREITDMRERITRVETRIVIVVGIATVLSGVVGHVLARLIGG